MSGAGVSGAGPPTPLPPSSSAGAEAVNASPAPPTSGGGGGGGGASSSKKAAQSPQRQFQGEIRMMMYGFGDLQNPNPQTIRLVEDIAIDYMIAMVTKASALSVARRKDRPSATDIKFIIRKDLKKLYRVRYLLELKSQIDKLKSNFMG